jgi:hypothetical protein
MGLSISEKIERKCPGRAICRVFENVRWSEKSAELVGVGLLHAAECKWSEVSAQDAQALLAACLSTDLSYGTRRRGMGSAPEMAAAFAAQFGSAARFYTNSETPYHLRGSAWCYTTATGATTDTGVVVRQGRSLVGVLWLSDPD